MNRQYNIQRATSELFDIVVIGGGITGAGIALAAARKGWKTLIKRISALGFAAAIFYANL